MPLTKKSLIKKIKKASLVGDDDLLSRLIWQAFSDVNKKTKLKLDNKADLTSLVPMACFVAGILEMIRRPILPTWHDWLWWSYSTFRDLNSEKRKVPHFHSGDNDDKE